MITFASLGQGFLSGRIKSGEETDLEKQLGPFAAKGFGSPENFGRLRRCEILAKKRGCSVPQIALAWVLQQELNTFAVVSASHAGRIRENTGALGISLTPEELAWLM